MPNPLAEEARALSDEELGEAINEAYREMFNLQFQRGTRQLQNPMAIRAARRQIARLRTIYRERQQGGAIDVPIARPTAPAVPPPSEVSSEAQSEDAPAEEDAVAAEVEPAEPTESGAEPTVAADSPPSEVPSEDAPAEAEEDTATAEVEAADPAENDAEPTAAADPPKADAAQTSKDD